jgi:5-methylthioribose kinase
MNTLRERLAKTNPGQFFLDADDPQSLSPWLQPNEQIESLNKAGEGNMNCTLRVVTNHRSFILKQARPWVEKYPTIDAPDERASVEAQFYQAVQSPQMPRLLSYSAEAKLLQLEDLTPAADRTNIYQTGAISPSELTSLTHWLKHLHETSNLPQIQNKQMRALNQAHIFDLPLRRDTGWNLEAWTPGLTKEAEQLWDDKEYCERVRQLGQIYLSEQGEAVLHGDYFPGSWLSTETGPKIIDPEFCFWGPPEWDLGVMQAHLLLAGIDPAPVATIYPKAASELSKAFAGVEIMRRLIGVAQLPLPLNLQEKSSLLTLSRHLIRGQYTLSPFNS